MVVVDPSLVEQLRQRMALALGVQVVSMEALARKHSISSTAFGQRELQVCDYFQGYFDLIPASADLISAEIELSSLPNPTTILKNKLKDLGEGYDYVVIDCPPSLGMLSVSALRAATKVLIPLQCEYYSLEGLAAMNKTIKEINDATGENIVINGILRTMYDSRIRLSREVSKELEEHFSEQLCDTVIPRNVKLAEAPSFGMPALYYEPDAKGTLAYLALAGEIINKFETSVVTI